MTPEDVWYRGTPFARFVRRAFGVPSLLFRGITALRNTLYDRGILRVSTPPILTISVGNLTVGGTGKTPVTAYIARALADQGARPAVVMRGYGGDEALVHGLLNPDVPVYADPDRVAAIARAAEDGALVAVLDDGFQHRRAGRHINLVLVSAEQWVVNRRMLPAGPYREPISALRRATGIFVTAKVSDPARVAFVVDAVSAVAPGVPVSAVYLQPHSLCEVGVGVSEARMLDLGVLHSANVLAVAAIGDPDAFFAQVWGAGATVTCRAYRDHHAYTPADVAAIIARAEGHKYVVTTLKDAVKLAPLWPAKGPSLWYVSQAVEVSDEAAFIDTLIARFSPS